MAKNSKENIQTLKKKGVKGKKGVLTPFEGQVNAVTGGMPVKGLFQGVRGRD